MTREEPSANGNAQKVPQRWEERWVFDIHHPLRLCLTRLTIKSFKKMKSRPTSNRALNLVFARARNLKIKWVCAAKKDVHLCHIFPPACSCRGSLQLAKLQWFFFTPFTPFRCGIYSHPSRQYNHHKLPSVNNLAIIFLSHLQIKTLECTKVITSVVAFQEEVEALILFCHDGDVYWSPFCTVFSETQ